MVAEAPAQAAAGTAREGGTRALGHEKVVVFFAPEAGVVPHYMAHCVVAKSLESGATKPCSYGASMSIRAGIVVTAWGCRRISAMTDRRAICVTCHDSASEMTAAYGLSVVDLRDFVDRRHAEEIDHVLEDLPQDLTSFEFGACASVNSAARCRVTFKKTDFGGSDPMVRQC